MNAYLVLLSSYPAWGLKLAPTMIFDISAVALDVGINMTSITNEGSYIKVKGISSPAVMVQQFTNGLVQSWEIKSYGFSDIVPFLENDEFVVILKRQEASLSNQAHFVTITSPSPRQIITSSTILEGRCSREASEVYIAGAIEGKTQCINGSWKFILPKIESKNLKIIGINVSQRMMNQEIIRDYRSFKHP
jgi:hypothetical protein